MRKAKPENLGPDFDCRHFIDVWFEEFQGLAITDFKKKTFTLGGITRL
jgi:hypothetical protein